MFDQKKICELINLYLSYHIDESTFCGEFHYLYNIEFDHNTLTEKEREIFSELREVASRFSEFEEDHQEYPGVFYTKKQLNKKVAENKERLKNSFKELHIE